MKYETKDVGTNGRSVKAVELRIIEEVDSGVRLKAPEFEGFAIPEEFNDYLKVLEMGANKHGADNWLEPNGSKSSFKQMHDSMFHHLAESFSLSDANNIDYLEDRLYRRDKESGLDPLLHLICRAQMMYTRLKRGIRHKDD